MSQSEIIYNTNLRELIANRDLNDPKSLSQLLVVKAKLMACLPNNYYFKLNCLAPETVNNKAEVYTRPVPLTNYYMNCQGSGENKTSITKYGDSIINRYEYLMQYYVDKFVEINSNSELKDKHHLSYKKVYRKIISTESMEYTIHLNGTPLIVFDEPPKKLFSYEGGDTCLLEQWTPGAYSTEGAMIRKETIRRMSSSILMNCTNINFTSLSFDSGLISRWICLPIISSDKLIIDEINHDELINLLNTANTMDIIETKLGDLVNTIFDVFWSPLKTHVDPLFSISKYLDRLEEIHFSWGDVEISKYITSKLIRLKQLQNSKTEYQTEIQYVTYFNKIAEHFARELGGIVMTSYIIEKSKSQVDTLFDLSPILQVTKAHVDLAELIIIKSFDAYCEIIHQTAQSQTVEETKKIIKSSALIRKEKACKSLREHYTNPDEFFKTDIWKKGRKQIDASNVTKAKHFFLDYVSRNPLVKV